MIRNRIVDFKKVETTEKSIVKNNNTDVVGFLVDKPHANHKNMNVQYYIAYIRTEFVTKDDTVKTNVLPILLTERDMAENDFEPGDAYLARGRWSSVRHEDGTFSEFLFAKKILKLEKETVKHSNRIILDGYVRRVPVFREYYTESGMRVEQAETLITIPRPAGRTEDGKEKIKTDTVTVAFRGGIRNAALALQQGDRIAIKGYLEECKDKDGNLVKYVAVPMEVTVVIEVEEKTTTTSVEE